ncbi:MAG TPA: hypothetical protein VEF04_22880 [Blastocatellia bacterium]|nr:hypothetical protein [Blastocatellia bacterium]
MKSLFNKFALSLTLSVFTCFATVPGTIAAIAAIIQSESECSEQFEEKEIVSRKPKPKETQRKLVIYRRFIPKHQVWQQEPSQHHITRHCEPSCYRYFSPLTLRAPPLA